MGGRPWRLYTVLPFPLWCRIGDTFLSFLKTAQHLQETFAGKMFIEKYQCLSSRGALPPSQGQSIYILLESWAFWVGFGYLEGSFDSQHFRASFSIFSGVRSKGTRLGGGDYWADLELGFTTLTRGAVFWIVLHATGAISFPSRSGKDIFFLLQRP